MRHPRITSVHNPRIKSLIQLRKRRERDRLGLMLIEGSRELALALRGGVNVVDVYVCSGLETGPEDQRLVEELESRKIKPTGVSSRVFGKIAYREGSSCFVAVAEKREHTLERIPLGANPLFLVIDAVEKPGNLGAMLRSADAAAVTGLIISDPKTDIYNPNVVRSSLGTVFTVPVAVAGSDEARKWLRENGIRVVTSTPRAETVYTSADLASPCAIVVGSEELGVGNIWLESSDLDIMIPMRGEADSLNVSAAAAVLLYEALRQRTAAL